MTSFLPTLESFRWAQAPKSRKTAQITCFHCQTQHVAVLPDPQSTSYACQTFLRKMTSGHSHSVISSTYWLLEVATRRLDSENWESRFFDFYRELTVWVPQVVYGPLGWYMGHFTCWVSKLSILTFITIQKHHGNLRVTRIQNSSSFSKKSKNLSYQKLPLKVFISHMTIMFNRSATF